MRCVVYTRTEQVVYVVGLPGPVNALADALLRERPLVVAHNNGNKGFRSMSDKDILYCERVGSIAKHLNHEAIFERARRRAEALNVQHGDLEVV
jgi:hypothetical protein